MKTLSKIYDISVREFQKIGTDINLLLVLIVAPLLYPFLYGGIYYLKVEKDVPVVVVDKDNSEYSRAMIKLIDATQSIKVIKQKFDQKEIEDLLVSGKIHSIIEIPKDFSKSLIKGKQTEIYMTLNSGRLLVLSDIAIPVSQNVAVMGAKVTGKFLQNNDIPVIKTKELIQPLGVSFQTPYNPFMTYGDMVLPGLVIMIYIQILFIGVAAATAKECEGKHWGSLMKISKSNIFIILGRVFPYMLIFTAFWIFARFVMFRAFDIPFLAKDANFMIIYLLSIISITLAGTWVGTFLKYKIMPFVVLGFTTYPIFMMSGYAWPSLQLPLLLKYVGYAIPHIPILSAVFSMAQMGTDLSYIIPQIINTIVLIIIFAVLNIFRFRKIRKRYCPE
jgi:ABC-2 type transport system permease protein